VLGEPLNHFGHRGPRGASFEPYFLVEKRMGIDLRLPIGIVLPLLGLISAAYGILAASLRCRQFLGVGINLVWATALLAFGSIMLLLARRKMHFAPQKSHSSESSDH
jgi:hypothetical protein